MSPRSTRCSTGWRSEAGSRAAGSKRRASAAAATTGLPPTARKSSPPSGKPGPRSRRQSTASRRCSMPEWREELRHRLAALHLAPAEEAGIVEELAQHLEDQIGRASCRERVESEVAEGGVT